MLCVISIRAGYDGLLGLTFNDLCMSENIFLSSGSYFLLSFNLFLCFFSTRRFHFCLFANDGKQETHAIDIFQIMIIIIFLPTSSVIFSCAHEESRPGSVHAALSVWLLVILGSVFVPDANLQSSALRPEALHMYFVQNNMSRHAKPFLPALLFVKGLGKYLTHQGGQSVPLHLHHKAVALTAVGSRCSEVTVAGLRGRHHSDLQGLHI